MLLITYGLQHLKDTEQSHIRFSKSTIILGKQRPYLEKPESLKADQLHELGQLGHRAEIPYRVGRFKNSRWGPEGS